MTYTFVRIKVHPKLDLTGWYLAIPAAAVELQMQMHKSTAIAAFHKFFLNPHVFDQKGEPKFAGAEHYHPVKLAAGWIQSALKGLMAHGVVYMNTAHGLLFGENVDVLETRTSDKLGDWPKDDNKDGVKIAITSWRGGEHFYLSASNNQVFSKNKYDTYEEAMVEALKYAFTENITYKPNYQSFIHGD